MKTAFISGHIVISQKEFDEYYIDRITKAVMEKHQFVVGDANGADTMAQFLLKKLSNTVPDLKVTVYHMFDSPRNNVGNFPTAGGFTSDNERDSEMTRMSDYDIVWIRPLRENSGTAKNVQRRIQSS